MSSGMDAREFLDAVTEFAVVPGRPARLATVDPAYGVSGMPRVTFDGETVMGLKVYPYLGTRPVASDRVVLLPVGRSYVILGTVKVT